MTERGMDLRALLALGRVIHVPGVYDPMTAALAVRAGHRAAHFPGTAVAALTLGRSGAAVAHSTQIADRARTLTAALDGIPLLADAGDGFDTPTHAVWTGLAYVRAGITALHLPDQADPDAGSDAGSDAGPDAAMISALARDVPELALVARVEAYVRGGLTETIERCAAYSAAGADAVLPVGVDKPDELAQLHHALPGTAIALERSEVTGQRPARPDADLAALGVRLVLHPLTPLLAALRAASLTYRALAEQGTADDIDRLPWAAFTELTTTDEPAAADARYVPAALET